MDSISIEQTNKVRLALGLKPLPVPGVDATRNNDSGDEDAGSTLESRQAQAGDNWKKKQDEAAAEAKRKATSRAIAKAKEMGQRYSKIEGKGLGDQDDDLDARAWLAGSKKRQKKLEKERAARIAKELEERDNLPEYDSKDLEGLKVAHDVDEIGGEGEHILTLKDATIEENEEEGDELENADLVEQERLAEKLDLKKKKPVYNPMDDAMEGGSSILKQYDETIDGKKRKRFTLDQQGLTPETKEAMKASVGEKLRSQPISLDFDKSETPISDYQTAAEPKFKKSKKKAKARQKPVEEDDAFPSPQPAEAEGDAMQLDSIMNTAKTAVPRNDETPIVDDDDLQASLAMQRRLALKKRKRQRPEDIARQIREEASATPDPQDAAEIEEPGLVIDETSMFVAKLEREAAEAKTIATADRPHSIAKSASPNPIKNEQDPNPDIDMKSPTPETPTASEQAEPPAESGLAPEEHVGTGLGATLRLLTSRGLITPQEPSSTTPTSTNASNNTGAAPPSKEITALHRSRQRFLAAKHASAQLAESRARSQREADRTSGRLDRMSAREREDHARWENRTRETAESRQQFEVYAREYKPDVQLRYLDDLGRELGQKEAFKHLSHQFHGKGSGKQKTEKRLKKVEQERKREAESVLDGRGGRVGGLEGGREEMGRRKGEAGVRLA